MERTAIRLGVIGTRGFPNVEGGVERHCEQLYDQMPDGVSVRVYRRKAYVEKAKTYDGKGNISFVDLPSTTIKGIEPALHTFLACLHLMVHRVDVVHVHNIGPGLFIPLLKLFGMKVVTTYHSANYNHEKWGKWSKKILKFGEYITLKYSDFVIFVNKVQRESFGDVVLRKSAFLPNGVGQPIQTRRTDFLERHHIAAGHYLLAVGRITPEKGLETLMRAISQEQSVETVVLAGSTTQDKHYLKRLKALDTEHKVIFVGSVFGEELAQLYVNARLFVLPSLSEGFPLSMLEAMSYGLPMVVSDLPATRQVSLPSEDYAKVGDEDDLAAKIAAHLKSPDTQCRYDLSSFQWETIAASTYQIYKRVTG